MKCEKTVDTKGMKYKCASQLITKDPFVAISQCVCALRSVFPKPISVCYHKLTITGEGVMIKLFSPDGNKLFVSFGTLDAELKTALMAAIKQDAAKQTCDKTFLMVDDVESACL